MYVFCKLNIVVGLISLFNIAKTILKLAGRIQNACAVEKDRASEGFCIPRTLYKRLFNVQIDQQNIQQKTKLNFQIEKG